MAGRISEVLALKVKDVDLSSDSVTLKTLKQERKDTLRTLPLHPELKKAFLSYISSYEFRNRIIRERKLFPMSRSAVDQFLKKMGKELGIKIHAHKFRHTFAVNAILSDVPLNILQGWLGHTNIWTTNTYTRAIGIQTQEYMNRMKWVSTDFPIFSAVGLIVFVISFIVVLNDLSLGVVPPWWLFAVLVVSLAISWKLIKVFISMILS